MRNDRAATTSWRCGGRPARHFVSASRPGAAAQPKLLEPDVNRPAHFAFPPPLRPQHALTGGGTRIVTDWTAFERRMPVVRIFLLERLSQSLQFENQRLALRTDPVAAALVADPAPGDPLAMLQAAI
jgi:hypothetical protein